LPLAQQPHGCGRLFPHSKGPAPQSVEFAWNSQQLLDLGLMELGQWF
jgi:hypothetical protein